MNEELLNGYNTVHSMYVALCSIAVQCFCNLHSICLCTYLRIYHYHAIASWLSAGLKKNTLAVFSFNQMQLALWCTYTHGGDHPVLLALVKFYFQALPQILHMHTCILQSYTYLSYIYLQETALLQAAMHGHAEIISVLVDAGAQLESKDNRNVSAWDGIVEYSIPFCLIYIMKVNVLVRICL